MYYGGCGFRGDCIFHGGFCHDGFHACHGGGDDDGALHARCDDHGYHDDDGHALHLDFGSALFYHHIYLFLCGLHIYHYIDSCYGHHVLYLHHEYLVFVAYHYETSDVSVDYL